MDEMENKIDVLTIEDLETNQIDETFTWAHRISNRAMNYLDTKSPQDDQPFLMVLSYDEPHHPFTCPPQYLKKYQEQLVTKKEEIARAISLEMGKPYWEALTEAGALIAKIDVTINDSLPRVKSKIYEEIMPSTNGLKKKVLVYT